jgi:hypothetical protein
VRRPIPGTSVEVDYRFERSSERTDLGSMVTHSNAVGLVLNLALTEWLNLSLGVPYQFLTAQPADRPPSTQTNNFGDLTAEAFLTLLRDPVRRLSVSVGFDVGSPTGSIRDGTGGRRRWPRAGHRAVVERAQPGGRPAISPRRRPRVRVGDHDLAQTGFLTPTKFYPSIFPRHFVRISGLPRRIENTDRLVG